MEEEEEVEEDMIDDMWWYSKEIATDCNGLRFAAADWKMTSN